MSSDIDRKQILKSFLENITCISDEQYQKRVWIRAEGPECDDIDDTICDFFDDGDSILEKHKDFEINDIQYGKLMVLYKKLREFSDTFDIYHSKKSTEELIQLPQWEEIRNLAKKVIDSFNSNGNG